MKKGQGVTLIETIFATAFFLLVAGIIFSIFGTSMKNQQKFQEHLEVQRVLSQSLLIMTRELREANGNPTIGSGGNAIIFPKWDAVKGQELVTYWRTNDGMLLRKDSYQAQSSLIGSGITALNFTFDPATNKITIQITAKSTKNPTTPPTSLITSIRIRIVEDLYSEEALAPNPPTYIGPFYGQIKNIYIEGLELFCRK